jgi:hypothetical protein
MGLTTPRALATSPLAIEPRPTIPLPDRWTFWADTMIGATPLGMVDVSSFYCVKRLSGFGHGNVTVNLPCGIPGDVLRRLWSWRLWAMYGGEPYWCGVPTGLADQNGSAHVQLTLTELPGYLTKRAWDVYPDRRYVNTEQTQIARDIAEPVADVGVIIITDPGTGYRRDRTYEFLESGNRGTLLSNLAGVLQGPEFRTEYRMNPASARPECILRIAYPRVGNDGPGLGITVPGAAVGYRAQWDSDELRTVTFAVGDVPSDAPEGTPRPVAIQRRPQPDLPRLDAVDDWPGTILQSTLNERAITGAERQAAPALNMTASPPEELPDITGYGPGDTVTVRAVTPLIPEGMEVAGRLSQIEVNAAEGVATWTIIGSTPAPVTRETVNDRLERIDSTVAQMFHAGELVEVGTPPVEAHRVTGRGTAGTWNLGNSTAWARVSDYGTLRASPPVNAMVVIEALGVLDWRANDIEIALSWPGATGAGQVANARLEGRSLPVSPLAMTASVTATAIVTASGQLRAHVSARIAPDYRFNNMAGGDPVVRTGDPNNMTTGDQNPNTPHNHSIGHTHTAPTGNADNNWVLEGDTGGAVGFNPAVETNLNIVARFGSGGIGQQFGMRITRVQWYGGAMPG